MVLDEPFKVTAVAPESTPFTVRSPVTVIPLVLVAMVILADESFRSTTDTLPEFIVTVPDPELASKYTLLVSAGIYEELGLPPEEPAQ
jgi:hypothetical protein